MRVPFLVVLKTYPLQLVLGILATTTTFLIFYLMTVFALSWATSALKIPRVEYLIVQMIGVLFFGLTIPISAIVADRIGGRMMLIIATLAIMVFGFLFAPLFGVHDTVKVYAFVVLGFSLGGLHLRALRQRARIAVSDGGALYRHVVGLQLRWHSGRLAGTVDRHTFIDDLRAAIRGLLSVGDGAREFDRAAAHQGAGVSCFNRID